MINQMSSEEKPVIILHNLRSVQNVGAIIRTAACFGDFVVFCTGYTPYPKQPIDTRLPHIANKQSAAIAKTSLGAELMIEVRHGDINDVIPSLKQKNYDIVACEQIEGAVPLGDWQPSRQTALIFGNEPDGIDEATLSQAQAHIEIPMTGKKESLNVSAAAAIVLYEFSAKLIHNTR